MYVYPFSYNVNIHHNEFYGTRDDTIQLGTRSYNIEFAYNKMIDVFYGPARMGSGDSLYPGTKYFHHNIFKTKKYLYVRYDPEGILPYTHFWFDGSPWVYSAPIGNHLGTGYAVDPWKIYHNTFVFGRDRSQSGSGVHYRTSVYDLNYPHEVYNNIFYSIHDGEVLSSAIMDNENQMYDGNLYYRNATSPVESLLYYFKNESIRMDFDNLNDFKTSSYFATTQTYYTPGWENSGVEADPELDTSYRPSVDGPASFGAVDLSGKGWPGLSGETFRGAIDPNADFTCQNQGYECCDVCESMHYSDYESDCSGQVCCDACATPYYVDATLGDDSNLGDSPSNA